MHNYGMPKDEEARYELHLADVMERATALQRVLTYWLGSIDRAELAEPLGSLILEAYAAGRLNQQPTVEDLQGQKAEASA